MHPLINIALRAARDAGEALAKAVDRLDRIRIVSDDEDSLITSADQEANQTILYHLDKSYPNHGIISRVSGSKEGKADEPVWLVDSLLGTRNFIAGYPVFGVSIACQVGGIVTHAVITVPLLHEEYVASRGTGAQLNSRRIRTSQINKLPGTLLGLAPDGLDTERFTGFEKAALNAGASIRISGSSALDMVAVASGRLQGGWCSNPSHPTLAAAGLILNEAGSFIGSESGNPDTSKASELIFGNPKIFRELVMLRSKI